MQKCDVVCVKDKSRGAKFKSKIKLCYGKWVDDTGGIRNKIGSNMRVRDKVHSKRTEQRKHRTYWFLDNMQTQKLKNEYRETLNNMLVKCTKSEEKSKVLNLW